MNHTTGPWKPVNCGQHWNNSAVTNWQIQYGEDGECISDHVYEEADARLIAASPTLLSEMERYLPVIEFIERDPSLWMEATLGTGIATGNAYRHAIAKATGKEPA